MPDARVPDLVATVVEPCGGSGGPGPGRPPAGTGRVLATPRRFPREGTPWRGLRATPAHASGPTRRRRLAGRAAIGLPQRARAAPAATLRGDPGPILASRSARAGRGGDLAGPNPTERGARHHVAVTGDGVPAARAATAATVDDTVPFERPFLTALAVVARSRAAFADEGCDAEAGRGLRRPFGAGPFPRERGRPRGSGPGRRRWPVERSDARPLGNKRPALRHDRPGLVARSLLQAARPFPVAGRPARES